MLHPQKVRSKNKKGKDGKIMSIYLRAPKTLGEGIKRVVKKAGNGTPGNLQKITKWQSRQHIQRVREYTNGVVITKGLRCYAIGSGNKLKAFVDSHTAGAVGWFQKVSGWINGKLKVISTELDIHGNHVNRSVTKNKNAVKNYISYNKGFDELIADAKQALEQANIALKNTIYKKY